MNLAPILLFVYKRPVHTRLTLEALKNNFLANESELFVVSDAPRNPADKDEVESVRELVKSNNWCAKVHLICNEKNLGMNDNFFFHITSLLEKYGRLIVLEDDLCTSPYFLKFMNENLELYQEDKRVMQITGFNFKMKTRNLPSSFLMGVANGWGWATWNNRWQKLIRDPKIVFDKIKQKNLYDRLTIDKSYPDYWKQLESNATGIHNDWDIKWFSSFVLENGLCLYPKESLVVNIGFDGTGMHFKNGNKGHETILSKKPVLLEKQIIEENELARKYLRAYFFKQQPGFKEKVIDKLKLIKRTYFKK